MEKRILLSLPIEELQSLITDCVNSCLQDNQQKENTQFDKEEKFLTVDEAAELLHLSKPTVYSKVSKDELPGVMKRGKRLYFSQTELFQYLKAGRKLSNADIEAAAEAYFENKRRG
jgi:excisionase family DNA binding protein